MGADGKTVLVWVSRHELNEKNNEILKRAFGDYEIVRFSQTVTDVSELVKFANENDADAYVVVLPPHLIQQLMNADRRPIYRFVVNRIVDESGNATFVPIGLERIVKIEVVTERIV